LQKTLYMNLLNISRSVLIALSLLISCSALSSELNCQVQVVAPKLTGNSANTEIIASLQTEVLNFMNNTKWSQDVISDDERIDCSVLITLDEEVSTGNYRGSIQVQCSRPVFNSNYLSPLFKYKDVDFDISYARNTALIFTPDRHTSNLTSVLAFYAFMMLGYDYDTFALEGGTKYYLKARQIVTNASTSAARGWKTDSDRNNRFHLVENVLQSAFKPLRKCMYNYHRKGFDIVYDKKDEGINMIVSSLEEIRKVHRVRANTINQQLFFTAKVDELVNIFKEATPAQISRFKAVVKETNAVNMSSYNKVGK
jgi:hypothetical protein